MPQAHPPSLPPAPPAPPAAPAVGLGPGLVVTGADWSVPAFPFEDIALWQPTEVMRVVVVEAEAEAENGVEGEGEPESEVEAAPEPPAIATAEPEPTPIATAEPEPTPIAAAEPEAAPEPTPIATVEPAATAEPAPEPAATADPAPAPLDPWGWAEPWVFEIPVADPARRQRAGRPRRRGGRGHPVIPLVVIVAAVAVSVWIAVPRSPTASARPAPAADVSVVPHPSAYALSRIPGDYLRYYWRASAEYGLDWTKLAAVGQIESDQGRSATPGVAQGTNPSGAAGPAQFLGSTWARYGVDVDGHGAMNPYDPADAITAMAAYLKASGAPEDWRAALFAYNHSTSYVDAILALSRRYGAP